MRRLFADLLARFGVCLVSDEFFSTVARMKHGLNALEARLEDLEARMEEFDVGVKS